MHNSKTNLTNSFPGWWADQEMGQRSEEKAQNWSAMKAFLSSTWEQRWVVANSNGVHEHGGSSQKNHRVSESLFRRRFVARWSFVQVSLRSLLQFPLPSLSRRRSQPLPGRQQTHQTIRQLFSVRRHPRPPLQVPPKLPSEQLARSL